MRKIKIAIVGAGGRMGQEILKLAANSKKIEVSEYVSSQKTDSKSKTNIEDLNPKKIDVLIDFSSPEALSLAIDWCLKNKKPLVSGTTGFNADIQKKLITVSKKIPIFWAANFSMGIALMAEMFKCFNGQDQYDFQIEELHHRHKKDKPSGTAIFLQTELKKYTQKSLEEPLAIRGGEIFGIHRLWAMSSSETIHIEHSALNRSVFAEGAIEAAFWIREKKKGHYAMRDMLRDKLKAF